MDATGVITPEQLLRRCLGSLSKCMTGFLVQRMSSCLSRSHTITAHETDVIASKATDMQKAFTMMQIVIRKGRSACSLFFACLGTCDPVLYETVTGCPVGNDDHHHHYEDISFSGKQGPYFITIHNSSLSNCIIGNNNKQCITCSQHGLRSQNDAISVDEMEDSHSPDQLIPVQDTISDNSVFVEKSQLEYVIIGDHNSMAPRGSLYSEVEEDTYISGDVND